MRMMLKVKVLTIGRCKESWLEEALGLYENRLRSTVSITWHLAKDDGQLIEWTHRESFIALDPKGEFLTSEAWAKKMEAGGARLVFVIGGAEGLPTQIVERALFRWSLSPLTFTHQMTRLILVEQIYRAKEIERGSRYHK